MQSYQTRYTFASNLLMLGALPLYVATQMGHADTTMMVHLGQVDRRKPGPWTQGTATAPVRADEPAAGG